MERLRQTVEALVERCTDPAAAIHAAVAASALAQLGPDTAAAPYAALLRRVSSEAAEAEKLQRDATRLTQRAAFDAYAEPTGDTI